ncbi:hypothetical protein [Nostoc sphaeroides]|uniref:hypothetical protein n=1 Tax=Nostoc sphaeroides TaxID=446679 RepID=UPI001C70A795|nr:hypothetical protein [Nostoc sphaeroides]
MGTLLYNCVPYRHEIIEFSQIKTSYYSLSDRSKLSENSSIPFARRESHPVATPNSPP